MKLEILLSLCLTTLSQGAGICYPKYGCFSNDPPFDGRPLVNFPQHPTVVQTKFRLFTRASSSSDFIDDTDVDKLKASNYDGKKKTTFIIHGWLEHGAIPWINRMRAALLKKEDVNVITVDWYRGAQTLYPQAVGNARLVGVQVAELIKFLMNNTHNSAGSYYIVGFSLGAHIAGYAGTNLRQLDHSLGRITGLDPAAGLFEAEHKAVRLDSSDASFVDVIHTDTNADGLFQAVGHVDFYPNGGADQGCAGILDGPVDYFTCDHYSAAEYYTESVLSQCPMRAFACDNYNEFERGRCLKCDGRCLSMGYDVHNPSIARYGKHYLYANAKKPHCVYHYLITFKTGYGWFAGINDPVHVRIYGTKGETGTIRLKKRILTAGSMESFVVGSRVELGDLEKIDVRHNGLLLVEQWRLEKVVVRSAWDEQEYTACFDAWLSSAGSVRRFSRGSTKC